MNPTQIGTAIGGVILVVMQVANIITTGKVEGEVQQTGREVRVETDLITQGMRAQNEMMTTLRTMQKKQLEDYAEYTKRLDELNNRHQAPGQEEPPNR